MERRTKSEWFRLDRPIGEPEIRWNNDPYDIERVVTSDGTTIWFGQATNWKKEQNGEWTKLTTNENAKPLEKYLPEIVYGEDRNYFAPCEIPIYEKLYLEKNKKSDGIRKNITNIVLSADCRADAHAALQEYFIEEKTDWFVDLEYEKLGLIKDKEELERKLEQVNKILERHKDFAKWIDEQIDGVTEFEHGTICELKIRHEQLPRA